MSDRLFLPVRSQYELEDAKLAIYRCVTLCGCIYCDCKKWQKVQLSADEVELNFVDGRRMFKVSDEVLCREEKRILETVV